MVSSGMRKQVWCRRWRLFVLVAIVLIAIQLFMAISLFNMAPPGTRKVEHKLNKNGNEALMENQQRRLDKFFIDDNDDVYNKQSAMRHINPHLNNDQRAGIKMEIGSMASKATKPAINASILLASAPCQLQDADVISALKRATTLKCQRQIVDLGCQLQKKDFYTISLPRYCPLQESSGGQYLGCYKDNRDDRDLKGLRTATDYNSPQYCTNYCLRSGQRYAGLQFGRECWCGDHYGRHGELPESSCGEPCPRNRSVMCGGYLSTSIYNTGFGDKPGNTVARIPAGPLHPPNTVRVVFVLSVNGRAYRQVLRLFKAIFHINHYYYIHVDSRQEMLHRELSGLEAGFPNVKLTKWRASTIWGGASLLQMQLRCMKDLLEMKDWHWDFFINLSESDFPIKTIEELTTWLTVYKGYNFLRSSGSNTPKFLRKQGMDRTFFECETHMWRMGSRPLLDGIRQDGGSDWIGLNRQFCRYVVGSTDPLVTGLKHYYKYTLLPAESFYHTVLHNSDYCDTWVDNNLHLTNWRRKQGCQCQYKHIVDWCGCSPNDFKRDDFTRIKDTLTKPVYFARKFEAVISNSIVTMVEQWLFGDYPKGTPGLNSYWQSEYDHVDLYTPVSDVYYSAYFSLSRLSVKSHNEALKQCQFEPRKILRVHLFFFDDQFKGILVNHRSLNSDGSMYVMESFVSPVWTQALGGAVGSTTRLKSLQVGTDYDPKELMFRNFGRLIGPNSLLVLRHEWGAGEKVTVKIVWVDPQRVVAGVFQADVPEGEWVGNQKPSFFTPLQPGVWTVLLLHSKDIIGSTRFLVMPLSHINRQSISEEVAVQLHTPPQQTYMNDNFPKHQDIIRMTPFSQEERELDKQKAKYTGSKLHAWIDQLMTEFWKPQQFCLIGEERLPCGNIPRCEKTNWSSFSPDPKAKLGQIDGKTGRIR